MKEKIFVELNVGDKLYFFDTNLDYVVIMVRK